MPNDLTIFAAKYLVYIDAVVAAIVILWLLRDRSLDRILRWVVAFIVLAVLSYIFAKIGAAVYNDPRPFTQDHVKPLISHAADNGFPSDHALLAAVVVAAVALISPAMAIPFVIVAVLIDWARVGAGIHHVGDVIGSSLFVAVATVVALLVAPALAERLAPLLPLRRDEVPASLPAEHPRA
jgi:undecaprenyl-diphosphatase